MYKVGRSRTPQGVRGLKPIGIEIEGAGEGRTPQGVRGLKPFDAFNLSDFLTVALRKECVD